MQRGRFITVEGGEGVGKSLFMSLLVTKMGESGIHPVRTREPGGTPSADRIREIFKHPPQEDALLPLTELFLVSAARAQHIGKMVRPTVERGEWVLCDRFYDSTRVYQGAMAGIPEATYEPVIAISVEGVHPDITFLLDCPVDLALQRIKGRILADGRQEVRKDRFDSATHDYHEKLRQAFLAVSRGFPDRIVLVDSSGDPQCMVDQALRLMVAKFGGGL